MVQGIQLAWIVVKDLKQSLKFFTETVGLKLHEHNEQYGWAELSGKEGIRLGIAQKSDHEVIQPGQNAVLTISVADLDKTRAEMVRKGAKMVGEVLEIPGHVKMQTVVDIDNNHFQIVQTF